MTNIIKKLLSLIILFCISISICGCNFYSTKKVVERRFAETELKLPNLQQIFDFKLLDDDSIAVIGKDSDGVLSKYISTNTGESWNKEVLNMYVEGSKTNGVNVTNDENIKKVGFLNATIEKDNNMAIIDCDKNALVNATDDLKANAYIYKTDNSKTAINISNQDIKDMQQFKYAYYGGIYAQIGNNKIIQFDDKTGKVKYSYNVNNGSILSICSNSNYLIVVTSKAVIKYDMDSGKEVEEIKALKDLIEVNTGNTKVFSGSIGGGILLTNSKGLFKYNFSDNSVKKIIDGSSNFIGDNQFGVQHVIEIDKNNYLILYNNLYGNDYKLCKYTYSKELSNKTLKEMKVYSLNEDELITQLIRAYQQEHKDVKIDYEVGMGNNNAITKDDAIKKLNSEIMAGKGPDVLFLDGISSEYYEKKGILEDLGGILDSKKQKLFAGIVNSCFDGKKVYKIPLRVQIPMIIGEKDLINNINDLQSLTETVENKLSNQPVQILFTYYPEDIVNLLYYTSTDEIIKNNKIDKVYLKKFLDNTKRLYTIVNSKTSKENLEGYDEGKKDFCSRFGVTDFSKYEYLDKELGYSHFLHPNAIKLDIGYATSFMDITRMLSVFKKTGNVGYKQFSGDGEKRYMPTEIAAINSKGKNKELAEKFISSLLDEKYQKVDDEFNIPINKNAMKDIYSANVGNTDLGSIGIEITKTNENIDCPIVWPTNQEYDEIYKIMENSNMGANMDTALLSPLTDGAKKYISGKMTLDQTVDYISKQMKVRLSE